jgi:hypothetical protein
MGGNGKLMGRKKVFYDFDGYVIEDCAVECLKSPLGDWVVKCGLNSPCSEGNGRPLNLTYCFIFFKKIFKKNSH